MSVSVSSHLRLKIAIRHVSRFNHALLSPSLCTSSSSSSSSHVPPPNSSRSLTSICHSAILHISCLPSHMFTLPCSHSPRLTCAIFTSSCLLELSVECVFVFFLFLFRSVIEGGGAYEIHKSFIGGVVIVHQEEREKKNQTIFIPYCSSSLFLLIQMLVV